MATFSLNSHGIILSSIGENYVSLQWPDVSPVQVSQDTISRSAVLRKFLPEDSTGDFMRLTLPTGVMVSWLQCRKTAPPLSASPFGDECSASPLAKILNVCLKMPMLLRTGMICISVSPARVPTQSCCRDWYPLYR